MNQRKVNMDGITGNVLTILSHVSHCGEIKEVGMHYDPINELQNEIIFLQQASHTEIISLSNKNSMEGRYYILLKL